MCTDDTVTVTAAEFHRNIGTYQDVALTKAVNITKNGGSRTVLISAEEYARLKRRDRRVIETGDCPSATLPPSVTPSCPSNTLTLIES
jgi:hypothetical protein